MRRPLIDDKTGPSMRKQRLPCRRWSLGLLLVAITACGAKPAVEADERDAMATNTSPSPRPEALVSPIAPADIQGRWEGILSCAGRDFPTTLILSADGTQTLNASWTVEPAMGRSSYISPDGSTAITDRGLRGDIDPVTGFASLQENGSTSRPLVLELLIQTDGALMSYQRCDFGILMPAPSQAVDDLRNEFEVIQQRVVIDTADQQGACPNELEQWIEAGLALPLDEWGRGDTTPLWSAEVTAPIFGQPVATLDAARRVEIQRALQGRCGVPGDRRRNAIVSSLARITDYRTFRNDALIAHSRALAKSWLKSRAEPLLEADPAPALEPNSSTALSEVPRRFAFGRLFTDDPAYDARVYAEEAVALNDRLMERRRLADYLDNMRGARFFKLQELWAAALLRRDIDDQAATGVAAERLLPTAEAYAEQVLDARNARAMADWVAVVEAGVLCDEPTRGTCQAAANLFSRRLNSLADEFAADSALELEILSRKDSTLATLAALIAGDRKLEQTYGSVLDFGAFPKHLQDRTVLRHSLQRDLESALAEQLRAARTTSALNAIQGRYFATSDLRTRPKRHLSRLGEVLDEQLSETRPFVATGADDYLNALYNREFSTLASLDAELLSGVLPVYRFMASQVNALAILLGASGQPLRSTSRELSNPSAATAVALRYLLDYDERYASCLGADAATITFTEQIDTVTRTAGGIELGRIQGVPVSTHYRIKRAHLELFADVFSGPEKPGSERVFEALFGQQGVTRLADAVRKLMAEHDCDSEAVQGFERGLLAYYADRKRRWGR